MQIDIRIGNTENIGKEELVLDVVVVGALVGNVRM